MAKHDFLKHCYKLSRNSDVIDYYDDRAQDYDHALIDDIGYVAPKISAELLDRYVVDSAAKIIDLGCGTGLVGHHLANLGYSYIDGADFSRQMLAQAESKSIYRNLQVLDLNEPIPIGDGDYDAAICVGSLSEAHINSDALGEIARIVTRSGIIVLTLNQHAIDEQGFAEVLQALVDAGTMAPIASVRDAYHTKESIAGDYLVYRRC